MGASAAELDTAAKSDKLADAPPVTNQLASFRIEPGFRIELVASEPTVTTPVAIAFDENGRLFVAEMRDYPDHRDVTPHLGRIRLLENIGDDGIFRSSTVYADDLPWPSGLACYAGGVFVAATPDIIYLKDSKRDGVADIRRTVLTGFGDTNSLNVRALVNSLQWGIDNRIHGITAGIGGTVSAPNWSSGPISLTDVDFAFDPRSLELIPEAGPSQSGLSFDATGRRFTCDYARPLKFAMYDPRYASRNPFYLPPPDVVDAASPATPVFRFVTAVTMPSGSRAAAAGNANPAPARETNVLALTWLTNAHGCWVYRGSAFPTNYAGNVFVADPSAHAIHREVLHDNGLAPTAQRAPEERQSEFLVSSDPTFQPVQVTGGPDGALYIVDRQTQADHGRIYRVVPVGFRRPKPPEVGKARTYDLVAALAGSDGWHGDTAGRLLYERKDPAAVGLLTNMLEHSSVPLARLRALRSLDGLGALRDAPVVQGLRDADARVRECSVQLSERLTTNGAVSDAVWGQLRTMADDPALPVRYQLAFTVGEMARPQRAYVLAQILRHDLANPWLRYAVASSLAEGAGDVFLILAGDAGFRNDSAGYQFLRELGTMIGAKGRLDEVRQVTGFLIKAPLERIQIFGLLAALGEGLRNTRSSLAMASPQAGLERFFSAAMETAIDGFSPPALRLEAVRLTGVSSFTFADTSDWLLMLCNPQPWLDLRSAAIATVAHYDAPGAVVGLLDRWQTFPLVLRNQAVASLLSRRSHVAAVLDALERGRLPVGDLSSTQLDFLRTYNEPAISERASRLLGPVKLHRPEVVDLFKPALRLTGVRERGAATFSARCAGCHRIGQVGQAFGPGLVEIRPQGKEQALKAILEPNALVRDRYATWVFQTMDGDNLVGIKTDDNLASITLRQPGGRGVVCPRLNLRGFQMKTWSLMPLGLEQGLSTQDMADLLEYVFTATP